MSQVGCHDCLTQSSKANNLQWENILLEVITTLVITLIVQSFQVGMWLNYWTVWKFALYDYPGGINLFRNHLRVVMKEGSSQFNQF